MCVIENPDAAQIKLSVAWYPDHIYLPDPIQKSVSPDFVAFASSKITLIMESHVSISHNADKSVEGRILYEINRIVQLPLQDWIPFHSMTQCQSSGIHLQLQYEVYLFGFLLLLYLCHM